ncbi:MAG: LacI family DNA-binding transcriptional regulator [Oscillospiraceae bacterium]|nr:LacI family DNA-binding transcriptional regulator [Oscillospiraceae bacterium]
MGAKDKITINDVAKAAGVSKTTVSRYINGRYELMSEKTRARVASVIELSHYRPSDIARSLKNRRSMCIGVLIADISSPYSSTLVHAVSNTLTEAGYIPLFIATNNDYAREKDAVSFLLARSVDGLIVNTTSAVNPLLISVANEGVPVVLCDREIRDYRFESVVMDNAAIMDGVLRHLKEEGYADVLFISQTHWENVSSRRQRQRGYLDGMRKYFGVADARERIGYVDPADDDSARHVLETLVAAAHDRSDGVPAVIAVNNVTTMLLLNAARAAGWQMPTGIGLCGCDDWGWGAQMSWTQIPDPAVTTYRLDAYEVGRQSALSLLTRIREPDAPRQFKCLPMELCVRGSTMLHDAAAPRP